MPRIPGKNLALYMDIAGGGSASPVPFISNFDIQSTTATYDVTAGGDTNHVYVPGLADKQGTYSGFYDDATQQMYKAATDGVARTFYFYPNTGDLTKYKFGTAFFDTQQTFPVDGAVAIQGNWHASGTISSIP